MHCSGKEIQSVNSGTPWLAESLGADERKDRSREIARSRLGPGLVSKLYPQIWTLTRLSDFQFRSDTLHWLPCGWITRDYNPVTFTDWAMSSMPRKKTWWKLAWNESHPLKLWDDCDGLKRKRHLIDSLAIWGSSSHRKESCKQYTNRECSRTPGESAEHLLMIGKVAHFCPKSFQDFEVAKIWDKSANKRNLGP